MDVIAAMTVARTTATTRDQDEDHTHEMIAMTGDHDDLTIEISSHHVDSLLQDKATILALQTPLHTYHINNRPCGQVILSTTTTHHAPRLAETTRQHRRTEVPQTTKWPDTQDPKTAHRPVHAHGDDNAAAPIPRPHALVPRIATSTIVL